MFGVDLVREELVPVVGVLERAQPGHERLALAGRHATADDTDARNVEHFPLRRHSLRHEDAHVVHKCS